MTTVANIHEAKTHFSKLLEQVARGESVVIARAGTPVAKLVPIDAPTPRPQQRIGFLAHLGHQIPDDFDTMYQDELIALFEGSDDGTGQYVAREAAAETDRTAQS